MGFRDSHAVPADVECGKCTARTRCPKWILAEGQTAQESESRAIPRVLKRGEHLFNAGATVETVDVVRSGVLKTFVISADGNEEVLGFHTPGDLVGIDALSGSVHHTYSAAVTRAQVCRLPVATLRRAQRESEHVRSWVLQAMTREVNRLQQSLQRMRYAAPARIASFLLSELQRQSTETADAMAAPISISRTDIGRHLNLATETVSRICTRLEDQGVLRHRGMAVEVLNTRALERDLARAAAE